LFYNFQNDIILFQQFPQILIPLILDIIIKPFNPFSPRIRIQSVILTHKEHSFLLIVHRPLLTLLTEINKLAERKDKDKTAENKADDVRHDHVLGLVCGDEAGPCQAAQTVSENAQVHNDTQGGVYEV
jgi:hypothetical protein